MVARFVRKLIQGRRLRLTNPLQDVEQGSIADANSDEPSPARRHQATDGELRGGARRRRQR
jgi:hypothetical protein